MSDFEINDTCAICNKTVENNTAAYFVAKANCAKDVRTRSYSLKLPIGLARIQFKSSKNSKRIVCVDCAKARGIDW